MSLICMKMYVQWNIIFIIIIIIIMNIIVSRAPRACRATEQSPITIEN